MAGGSRGGGFTAPDRRAPAAGRLGTAPNGPVSSVSASQECANNGPPSVSESRTGVGGRCDDQPGTSAPWKVREQYGLEPDVLMEVTGQGSASIRQRQSLQAAALWNRPETLREQWMGRIGLYGRCSADG